MHRTHLSFSEEGITGCGGKRHEMASLNGEVVLVSQHHEVCFAFAINTHVA
jgi:hypothetical protein